MNRSRHELIAALAADASAVTPPQGIVRAAIGWLLVTAVIALVALILAGPFRAGAFADLQRSVRFLLENLVGFAAILALAIAAFDTAIPSPRPMARRAALPLMLLTAWVGMYCYGLVDPALEPSMAGKRAHCWLEALAYGLPGLALGCYALRRWWPLHGAWSGLLLGLVAGAIPALAMQFACMVEPRHVLLFHLLPGLAVGPLGAVLGSFLLKPPEA